jgi:heptosyltransferase-3
VPDADPPFTLPPPEREVVIPTLAGIGNSIMAVPFVRQLRQAFPRIRITIATRTGAIGEVFRRLDEVDEVIRLGPGLAAALATHRAIRRRRPDAYVVPHPSARWQYGLLAATSGARWAVLHHYPTGYWRGLRFMPRLRTVRLVAERNLHDTVQIVRMLRAFGVEPDESQAPVFPLRDDDHAQARDVLKEHDADADTPFVAVMPGCAQTVLGRQKRWPPDRFGEAIDRIHREHGLRAVIVEGPDERGVGDDVWEAIPQGPAKKAAVVTPLRGNLGVAGALLSRARLYVGNDSALSHLAAAVGTVPITIFAAGDPVRGCPFGHGDLAVLPHADWKTPLLYPFDSPYPKLRDDGIAWAQRIEVDAVMNAVDRALTPAPPT